MRYLRVLPLTLLLLAACTNSPRPGTDFCQGTSLACLNTHHNHGHGGRNG